MYSKCSSEIGYLQTYVLLRYIVAESKRAKSHKYISICILSAISECIQDTNT